MTATAHTIPAITDPMGRHWEQPPTDDILIDDETALMPFGSFTRLAEYSTSIPSGIYAGKMWKSRNARDWYLRWYEDDPTDNDRLLIKSRKIIIVEP